MMNEIKTKASNRVTLGIAPFLLAITVMSLVFTGCSPGNLNDDAMVSPQQTEIEPVITSTTEPTPTTTPSFLISSPGPILLIETDFNQFEYVDLASHATHPFNLPPIQTPLRLAANRSPSGRFLNITLEDQTPATIDLTTGELKIINALAEVPNLFAPEQVMDEAFTYFPEIKFTDEAMISALTDAQAQSTRLMRWYRSDQYWLTVHAVDPAGTYLHLFNLHTDELVQLESLPGLVQNISIGPDPSQILLMKAFTVEPALWQDQRYYLVDVESQTTVLIPLPPDVDRPNVFWLTSQTLGIIHQTEPVGGIGFSVLDLETMTAIRVINADFSHIRLLGENLLSLTQDREANSTELAILSLAGETLQPQSLDGFCTLHTLFRGQMIFNCENVSLLMDSELQTEPFGEPVRIFSPAPDSQAVLLVDSTGLVYLVEPSLEVRQPITDLADMPLEIRWLPDSSGFLYRTRGQLHLYDSDREESRLLLESDIFSDYTNINAIWIEIEAMPEE